MLTFSQWAKIKVYHVEFARLCSALLRLTQHQIALFLNILEKCAFAIPYPSLPNNWNFDPFQVLYPKKRETTISLLSLFSGFICHIARNQGPRKLPTIILWQVMNHSFAWPPFLKVQECYCSKIVL